MSASVSLQQQLTTLRSHLDDFIVEKQLAREELSTNVTRGIFTSKFDPDTKPRALKAYDLNKTIMDIAREVLDKTPSNQIADETRQSVKNTYDAAWKYFLE